MHILTVRMGGGGRLAPRGIFPVMSIGPNCPPHSYHGRPAIKNRQNRVISSVYIP